MTCLVAMLSQADMYRRHQLSHQQAKYPCTFEDCEKAFHRPDLLARHMNRQYVLPPPLPLTSQLTETVNTKAKRHTRPVSDDIDHAHHQHQTPRKLPLDDVLLPLPMMHPHHLPLPSYLYSHRRHWKPAAMITSISR
jgi:hypothetical protein